MRPRATITAQNFPKPRRGSKDASIKAPVDVSNAVAHEVFVAMPLPSPILSIRCQKRLQQVIPDQVVMSPRFGTP